MIGKTNVPPGGVDISDTTAVAGDVLSPKTFYDAGGVKRTGTITAFAADQTASAVTTSGTDLLFTAPAGYYNGTYKVKSAVVKTTNQAASAISNTGTTLEFTVPAGYYAGSVKVTSTDANFSASNIKSGVTMFNVLGTYGVSGLSTQISITNKIYGTGSIPGAAITQICNDIVTTSENKLQNVANGRGAQNICASSDYTYIFTPGRIVSSGNLCCYRSTNKGYTWSATSVYAAASINDTNRVDCSSSGQYVLMYSTASQTCYRSTDYGASFTLVGGLGAQVTVRKIHVSSNGQYMFVVLGTNIYRSSDYGANFSSLGLTLADGSYVAFSDDGSIIFAPISNLIYKSTNYGTNFANTGYATSGNYLTIACSNDGATCYHVISGVVYKNGVTTSTSVYSGSDYPAGSSGQDARYTWFVDTDVLTGIGQGTFSGQTIYNFGILNTSSQTGWRGLVASLYTGSAHLMTTAMGRIKGSNAIICATQSVQSPFIMNIYIITKTS
jgi:hypothetical protein